MQAKCSRSIEKVVLNSHLRQGYPLKKKTMYFLRVGCDKNYEIFKKARPNRKPKIQTRSAASKDNLIKFLIEVQGIKDKKKMNICKIESNQNII